MKEIEHDKTPEYFKELKIFKVQSSMIFEDAKDLDIPDEQQIKVYQVFEYLRKLVV